MRNVILHILCEGKSESGFVCEVLRRYFEKQGVVCKATELKPHKKSPESGGLLSYGQFCRDLHMLQTGPKNSDYQVHLFSSMIDLYQLPQDFPGYSDSASSEQNIANVEASLKKAFPDRFIPYIQLHEFEALVFACLDKLPAVVPTINDTTLWDLQKVLEESGNNPERINGGKKTAPSKRLIAAFDKAGLVYNKPRYGVAAISQTRDAMDRLKDKCPHFGEWISKLESTVKEYQK